MECSPRNKAMDYLARREHSHQELARKLAAKGYSEAEASAALAQLSEEGLLSDERFAESYATHRANRGYGPNIIAEELKQKGVDSSHIADAFEALAFDWVERCAQAHDKKFGRAPKDYKEKAKQMRFLHYRGFTTEQINEVFNSIVIERESYHEDV